MKRRTGDRPPFRVRGLLIVAVVSVLLGACRVDTTVGVDLHRDGSGRVRVRVVLDEEAARAVPVSSIRLDDLQAAGWRVTRDARSITIEKPFGRPAELAPAVLELAGGSAPIGDASARRDRGFVSTDYELRVDLDLRRLAAGIGSDPDLQARLRLAGVDPAALELRADASLRRAVTARVVLTMPDGRVHTRDVAAGGHVDARATSAAVNGARLAWMIAAVVLAALGALLVLGGLFTARRRRQ
jgi:hypothetical protein